MNFKSAIIKYSFKQTKMIFLLSCMFSIVLGLIFEISYRVNMNKEDRSITISVSDMNQSQASNELIEYLENKLGATVLLGYQDTMENQVISFYSSAGLIIPPGFEQGAQPVLLGYEGDKIVTLIQMSLDHYFNSVNIGMDRDELIQEKQSQEYSQKEYAVKKALITTIGFLPQALMIIAICLSTFLMSEKQDGNLMRIYISPVSFLEYLIGRSCVALLASMIPALAIMGLATYRQGSYEDYFKKALLSIALFTVFMVFISFYLGLRCSTQNSFFMAIVGMTSMGSIIGGCFFDVEGTVKVIEWGAKLFPHYWLMKGSRDSIRNISTQMISTDFYIFLIFIVVALVLNYVTYRKLDQNGGKLS